MKTLKDFILEGINHDAENNADDLMKKYKNKTVKFDDFIKDAKDNFGWEFDEAGSTDDELSLWGNFTNNAEGDDTNIILSVKRSGNNIKILGYTIE